jgi:hypothetical protein
MRNRKVDAIEKVNEHANSEQEGDGPSRSIVRGRCSGMWNCVGDIGLRAFSLPVHTKEINLVVTFP